MSRPCLTCNTDDDPCRCPLLAAERSGGWTSDAQRQRVLERGGWLCPVCDRYINPRIRFPEPGSACLDRFRPRHAGGRDSEWNLRASHLECVGATSAASAEPHPAPRSSPANRSTRVS